MRNARDKCWWGAGYVNHVRPILRGCGGSILHGCNMVTPPKETGGNSEHEAQPKQERLQSTRPRRGCRRWRVFRCATVNRFGRVPLVQTRDHLGSLATGLRIGTMLRNSESLASFTAVT